jgi:hypothetical protein
LSHFSSLLPTTTIKFAFKSASTVLLLLSPAPAKPAKPDASLSFSSHQDSSLSKSRIKSFSSTFFCLLLYKLVLGQTFLKAARVVFPPLDIMIWPLAMVGNASTFKNQSRSLMPHDTWF